MFNVFELSFINKKRQERQNCLIDGYSVKRKLSSKTVLPVVLTPVSMAVFLFSTTANAACKNHNCACSPSVLQFATPTTTPDDDGQYPIVLEADDLVTEGEDNLNITANLNVLLQKVILSLSLLMVII